MLNADLFKYIAIKPSHYGGLSTLDETGKTSLVLKIVWSSKAMGAGMNCD